MQIGDKLYASDGTETSVIGLSSVREYPVIEVHFDDGQVVECGPEHLWKVSSAASRRVRTRRRRTRRSARYDTLIGKASSLRRLADEIGPGVVAPRSDIARLSGFGLSLVHRTIPDALAIWAEVATRKSATEYCMDDLLKMGREPSSRRRDGRRPPVLAL